MPQNFKRGFVAAYGFARGAKSTRLRQTQRRFMAHATGLNILLSLAVYVAHWQGRLTVTVFCQSCLLTNAFWLATLKAQPNRKE
jgi:hypothetical protein